MPKRKKHLKPEKQSYLKGFNRQMWRVVDGAIMDAFIHHPDYLTMKGSRNQCARRSIAKRVTGSVLSYLEQRHRNCEPDCFKEGRSG